RMIAHHLGISVMSWRKESLPYLRASVDIEIELLTMRNLHKWVDVFFDAFDYPNDLRKYISSMVNKQAENGIDFYVGNASGKDVSCFCVYRQYPYHGFYGVGTKHKFRRKGYASITLSNYMELTTKADSSTKFCLQVQSGSSAESLYEKIGFEKSFTQKRFDWDPSILGPIS
ncbi:MAG: GNAT family N-acetyltransferase, partial [Candidatus Heimdallarchaeaceae archaeon]